MGSSPSPEIPDLVDNSRFLHGRIDPGLEENYLLVEAVAVRPQDKAAEKGPEWDFGDASPRRQSPITRTFNIPSFCGWPIHITPHISAEQS
jgi:hypothetical protein